MGPEEIAVLDSAISQPGLTSRSLPRLLAVRAQLQGQSAKAAGLESGLATVTAWRYRSVVYEQGGLTALLEPWDRLREDERRAFWPSRNDGDELTDGSRRSIQAVRLLLEGEPTRVVRGQTGIPKLAALGHLASYEEGGVSALCSDWDLLDDPDRASFDAALSDARLTDASRRRLTLVRELLRDGNALALEREHGVPDNTIRGWLDRYRKRGLDALIATTTPEDEAKLAKVRHLLVSNHLSDVERRRLQAVLAISEDNATCSDWARDHGVHRNTVKRWMAAFARGDTDSLLAEPAHDLGPIASIDTLLAICIEDEDERRDLVSAIGALVEEASAAPGASPASGGLLCPSERLGKDSRGRCGEHLVAAHLEARGLQVSSMGLGAGGLPYDLMFPAPGERSPFLVQVKASLAPDSKGAYSFSPQKQDGTRYTEQDTDLVAFVAIEAERIAFLTIEDLDGRGSIRLRDPRRRNVNRDGRRQEFGDYPFERAFEQVIARRRADEARAGKHAASAR